MNIFVVVVIVKRESHSADSQNRRHFKNISANFALLFSDFFLSYYGLLYIYYIIWIIKLLWISGTDNFEYMKKYMLF